MARSDGKSVETELFSVDGAGKIYGTALLAATCQSVTMLDNNNPPRQDVSISGDPDDRFDDFCAYCEAVVRVYIRRHHCDASVPIVVQFSAYPNPFPATTIDLDRLLHSPAICGTGYVRMPLDIWGSPSGQDYMSGMLHDPTWLDLCVVANEAILTTGDTHHRFLEGVRETSSSRAYEGRIAIWELEMGS